jgi:hypothetical protein
MTDIINIDGVYRPPKPPMSRIEALRLRKERFFPPPNAVVDKPIDLSRPLGVTGSELIIRRAREAKERAEAAMKAEIERHVCLLRKRYKYRAPEPEPVPILLSSSVTVRDIQAEVCRQWHITIREMKSGRRNEALIRPRHLAYLLSRELTGYTLPQIGRAFNLDHTTVLITTRKFQWLADLLAKEEPKAQTLSELVARAKHHLLNGQPA